MTLTDKILNERIVIGGLPMTRATAYAWLIERGNPTACADTFAFNRDARLTQDEPMTLAQLRAIEPLAA